MPRIEKTSESNPIRVDFLPLEARLGPGRVGLTFAPGKQADGIDGPWRRDLETDLVRLRAVWRTDVILDVARGEARLTGKRLFGTIPRATGRTTFKDRGEPDGVR